MPLLQRSAARCAATTRSAPRLVCQIWLAHSSPRDHEGGARGQSPAPQGLASETSSPTDVYSRRGLHTCAVHRSDGLPNYQSDKYGAPAHISHVTPTQGTSRDVFKRTYVRGQPEPNSYRLGYDFVDYTTPEAFESPLPSSAAPHSSTSTEPANPNTTQGDLEQNDLKLPPDFDVDTRGQWMQRPAGEEKELPPAGSQPSGGTRELRDGPRGPKDAPKTMDGEQAPTASHSAATNVAKAQAATTKGADPASSGGHKDSHEAKPANPDDTLKGGGEPETILSAASKGKKSRSAAGRPKKS